MLNTFRDTAGFKHPCNVGLGGASFARETPFLYWHWGTQLGTRGGMIWVWQKQLRHNDPKDLWETANIVKLSLSKKSSSMESLYREFVMINMWWKLIIGDGTTGCPKKKCNIAIVSLNLFQRSDYSFSHVFRNQNFEPVRSKPFKHTHSEY